MLRRYAGEKVGREERHLGFKRVDRGGRRAHLRLSPLAERAPANLAAVEGARVGKKRKGFFKREVLACINGRLPVLHRASARVDVLVVVYDAHMGHRGDWMRRADFFDGQPRLYEALPDAEAAHALVDTNVRLTDELGDVLRGPVYYFRPVSVANPLARTDAGRERLWCLRPSGVRDFPWDLDDEFWLFLHQTHVPYREVRLSMFQHDARRAVDLVEVALL